MTTIAVTKVAGAAELQRLSRQLKEAGRGDLQRKLVRNIRREGDPGLRAVQAKFLGVDVEATPSRGGGGSTGLRARIAAATKLQVTGRGIRYRTIGRQVDPEYGDTLVNGVNNTGPWKHPVFGNRRAWVTQHGQEVFDPTLLGYEPRFRKACLDAMDETAAQIMG